MLGDLNDFQFSETLEILEGAGLANLMETLPANEQYSYVFDGNSQVLDQILVSDELMTPAPEYDSVHVNAEFADQASDHDPQIARVVVRGTGNATGSSRPETAAPRARPGRSWRNGSDGRNSGRSF